MMNRKHHIVTVHTISGWDRVRSSRATRTLTVFSGLVVFLSIVFGHNALSADAECLIPENVAGPHHWGPITDVYYGANAADESEFIVCGGSWSMLYQWEMVRDGITRLRRICTFPVTDGMTIAIHGNNHNNQIHSVGPGYVFSCDAWRYVQFNEYSSSFYLTEEYIVSPPSSWNIEELLILGKGGDDVIGGIQVGDIPNRIYGDFGDMITAPEGFDILYGGPGPDKIYGEGLDDIIEGGAGDDVLVGGYHTACNQTLQVDRDVIFGEEGDDFIYGDAGQDELCGLPLCGSGQIPGFDPEQNTGDGLFGSDGLHRGGDDILVGGGGGDHIFGGPGEDWIVGDWFNNNYETKDVLCGGPGRDVFESATPDLISYEIEGERDIQRAIITLQGLPLHQAYEITPIVYECEWDEYCPVVSP